jgi:hypothetical protein
MNALVCIKTLHHFPSVQSCIKIIQSLPGSTGALRHTGTTGETPAWAGLYLDGPVRILGG